jgi:hypothetical protein
LWKRPGANRIGDALKDRIASRTGLTNTYYMRVGGTDPAKNEASSYQYLDGYKPWQ